MRLQNQKLMVGMRIAPQDTEKAIEVEENEHPDEKGYIARVFYKETEDTWYAATNKNPKGLVVFIRKKPAVGEKIKIKKVYDNCATAEIVIKHKP